MSTQFDIIIVGAGHAGAQTAIALRQGGFAGSIAIVGEESELPYERPPLSKDYLLGEKTFERMLIRPASFWGERKINMLGGARVQMVFPIPHLLQLSDGSTLRYGRLVWAAGGHPRRIGCPGSDLDGVHYIRTRNDVDRLTTNLQSVQHVVIVGAGYIGLEAAAALRKLGKHVTVLELQDRVLARVAGLTLSRFYEAEHRAHGVDLRLQTGIDSIEHDAGHLSAVRLTDGQSIACQRVIVGIGIVPSVQPLLAAGASGGNGVLVDKHGHTSLPDIFAIGDCALHHNEYSANQPIRLESVQNANGMAQVVAQNILGKLASYDAVPWFWSNQYDLRLQTVGLSLGYDQYVLRGRPEQRSFSVVYLRQGRVIALDCVNALKDFAQGKSLVAARVRPDLASLADPSIMLWRVEN